MREEPNEELFKENDTEKANDLNKTNNKSQTISLYSVHLDTKITLADITFGNFGQI